MFKLKEKIIYPGHGVAVIDQIIERTVAGSTIKFLMLKFLSKDMTILLPLNNAKTSQIRYPESIESIKMALKELYKLPDKKLENMDFTPSGWNKRNKEYMMKIQSGVLIEIIQIYRNLMHVAIHKELSFGEKKLLQDAEDLLSQEIQLVLSQNKDQVLEILHSPFKQFFIPVDSVNQVNPSTAI